MSFDQYKTTSVAFGSSRRHLSVSRKLASEILSFTFGFSINVVCPDSGCNVDSITSAMEDTVSQVLTTSIANGELLSQVGDETNAVEYISGAITLDSDEGQSSGCSSDSSTQVGSSGTTTDVSTSNNSSVWYPAWGTTDKCSDAPGMPTYMQGNSHYTSTCKY